MRRAILRLPRARAKTGPADGSGCNPVHLVVESPPAIGLAFELSIPWPLSILALSYAGLPPGIKLRGVVQGELLVDPGTLFSLDVSTGGPLGGFYSYTVPEDVTLEDLSFTAQAAEFQSRGQWRFTNAFACLAGG